jgi:putative transposase
MQRAYKYRIYPNQEQETTLFQHFGIGRFVYNWVLDQKQDEYLAYKKWQENPDREKPKSKSVFDYCKVLTQLKKERNWLRDAVAQSLQQEINHAFAAFDKFYKTVKEQKAKKLSLTNPKGKPIGFSHYKSRRQRQSLSYPQGVKVDFKAQTVFIPKLGKVTARLHREFTGTIKTGTVSKETTGKYFISILIDDGKDLPNSAAPNESEALGIDVGLKDFATLSDGRKVKNPRLLKRSLRRLKRIQRSMARKTNRASANYGKAKVRRALLEERVANQRKDFLHQLTHDLVSESQATTFCVEDLSVKNMMANRKLAQSIADVSWGEFFRQLKYKAAWHGKNVLECGRFDPSSKTCGFCGFRLESLRLASRKWECPGCGVEHDRDLNAAENIVRFAFAKRLVV